LPQFNWLIPPVRAMGGFTRSTPAASTREDFHHWLSQSMPEIEITDECRVLIEGATEPLRETARRLPNGNWQIPIDAATRQRLERLRRQGESISDCIIRVIIIGLHRHSLQ
jgi:hypothetical protein